MLCIPPRLTPSSPDNIRTLQSNEDGNVLLHQPLYEVKLDYIYVARFHVYELLTAAVGMAVRDWAEVRSEEWDTGYENGDEG